MMTISRDSFRSPQLVFFLYIIASGILIIIFRLIFPGMEPPLYIFSRNWRFIRGLLDYLDLFPSLVLSALVIPFGIASFDDDLPSFTKVFFKHLFPSVATAIFAAVLYGAIFFFAFPLAKDYEENMRYKGELYKLAKERIEEHKKANEWIEISQLYIICENIWPGNPDMVSLQTEISINLERLSTEESEQRSHARAELSAERYVGEALIQDDKEKPLTAVDAIESGETALKQERFYDAHWFATLAMRISGEGSLLEKKALELAGRAWSKIESQAPNRREERLYSIYRKKLDGYTAYNEGEFIEAYFIFQELSAITPDDTDVKNFFALSEIGTRKMAFFMEEMEMTLGGILTGAIFSLPRENGRIVMRLYGFSTFSDFAYGWNLEYMEFDSLSRMTANAKAPYVKLLPYKEGNVSKVLILTHALNRLDEKADQDAVWYTGNKPITGILLDISFEDLLLLSQVRHGLQNLQFMQLYAASKLLGSAGYVKEIFEAEVINRLGAVIFFLPMAIFVIVIGWRYRAKTKPRYLFVPFFGILPVVFHGLVIMYRSVLNTVGIWLVISLGFSAALTVFIIFLAVLFFVSLIVLAAQHS